MRHNEYRSWYVRGVLKLSFHLSRLWVFVLLCLLEFFGVFLFFSPLYRCRVYHFFWWSCVYQTEISPFSLGKGRLRLRFYESRAPSSVRAVGGWKEQYHFPLLCVSVWFFLMQRCCQRGEKKNQTTLYLIYGSSAHSNQLKALWNLSLCEVVTASINIPQVKYVGGTEIESLYYKGRIT